MGQSITSASISLGLVTIPVRLYSATQRASSVSFNLLHKDCGTRVRQQYYCPKDEQIVARDEMVKGYEFAKGQFVVFTSEELKALEERSTQAIEISEFVPAKAVDPVYFDKPYYLAPDKGGAKAYFLLAEIMREEGRVAIARYAARGKQYLVMVRADERGLVMQELLYGDEVRPFKEVPLPDVPQFSEMELKLGRQLVDEASHETFDASKYEDEVKKRILADIQKKVEGQEIELSEPSPPPAPVIDLMEAIKASLKGTGAGGSSGRKGAAPSEAARKPAKAAKASKKAPAAAKPKTAKRSS